MGFTPLFARVNMIQRIIMLKFGLLPKKKILLLKDSPAVRVFRRKLRSEFSGNCGAQLMLLMQSWRLLDESG